VSVQTLNLNNAHVFVALLDVLVFSDGLKESTKASLTKKKKKDKAAPAAPTEKAEKEDPVTVHLEFKRYIFSKKMAQ
jgi:hypothetical protein